MLTKSFCFAWQRIEITIYEQRIEITIYEFASCISQKYGTNCGINLNGAFDLNFELF